MTDSRTASPWRLLLAPPRSAAENMARDAALTARARQTGEVVFSVYQWERPTLSLGRNQVARGRYDLPRLRDLGMEVVRRSTGGRALVHHREITYSVTAPIEPRASPRDWYARINRLLLDGLRRMGVAATEASAGGRGSPPDDSPCFATPARGEILVNGRKLVGSAQSRDRGALLQHGSILIEDDQRLIQEVSLASTATPHTPPATLIDLLGRAPTVGEVSTAMFDAVRELEDREATELAESEVRPAALDGVAEFTNEFWTWRR